MLQFSYGIRAEAVIFDFDGVIVDTEPLHYKAFQYVLEPLGLHYTWKEYVDSYIGFDDRDAFREAFRSTGQEIGYTQLESLIAQKAAEFQNVIKIGVTPYPGVIELIRTLSAAKIPLAICSGALRSDIEPILALFGLTDNFDTIVTADDVSSSKPDPECYERAFRQLTTIRKISILPSETLAIEDTPAGIFSATQAGLTVCAVTNSYPKEHLTAAPFCINSLENLLDFQIAFT